MKRISDLIADLQLIQHQVGDVEVNFRDGDYHRNDSDKPIVVKVTEKNPPSVYFKVIV